MTNNKSLTIYNSKGHLIFSVCIISIICLIGFESLVYVNNLYQPRIYTYLSIYIYFFILIWMNLIFDTHFRQPNYVLSLFQSIKQRFRHYLVWKNIRHFQNFLILPGIIYLGAVVLIYINFGHEILQQFIAIVSSIAMVISLTLFKEFFRVQPDKFSELHFTILRYVKIYAAWLIYAASLGIVWYYCFPESFFYLTVFLCTFMLLYQALFQIRMLSFSNFMSIFYISIFVALGSYAVYHVWNVNYFTAGLFMAALYNFLWSLMLNKARGTLTRDVLVEQIALFILISVMVLSVTNFRAQIDRC